MRALADLDVLCEQVAARSGAARMFERGRPVLIARAPGRLDVLGGIADYSGATVLEWPAAEAACAAVQLGDDAALQIASASRAQPVALPLAALARDGQTTAYGDAATLFAGESAWAAYVAGTLLVLMREHGARAAGARILIASDVPEGAGVSSSAAIEVATMRALAAALRIELDGRELARLCQIAENEIARAPCGIMDQMTSACARAGHLLVLRCQPAEIEGHRPLPDGVSIWGIHSGVRHAVSGDDYAGVRCAAFMGRRILEARAGVRSALADVDPHRFEEQLAVLLPERMTGRAFLAEYGAHADRATAVDPDRIYRVRAASAFPVHENARVRAALAADLSASALGRLLDASHQGYSACGLGAAATDAIAALVRAAVGLGGARISGGGCGGTVIVAGEAGNDALVERIAREHERRSGLRARVFRGTSPGACQVPVRVL